MAKKKLTLKAKKGGMNSRSRSRSRSQPRSRSRSRSQSRSKSKPRSRSRSRPRSKSRIDPYTARSKIDGFRFLDLYLDPDEGKYMPGSTIPAQKRMVEDLLQQEGPVAKGKACQGLPKDLVHSMLESQVESGYTPHNCGALRLLCQNPSCEKHCWNAPPRVKKVINGCKEVIKVNRCLSVLDDYKLVRNDYKSFILDNYDFGDAGLSYFHRIMKKRMETSRRFGPYQLMIGDYYDIELEEEIKELEEELSKARGVEQRDHIQEQLFQSNKELKAYNLPKAARPYVFTEDEAITLEKIFKERNTQMVGWAKYTMKACLDFIFGGYPEIFKELCLLFKDDNIDEDGDEIFQHSELLENGYPNGSNFLNGVMIYEIDEALDIFFKGDMQTWSRMLQVFENKGLPEDEKNIEKQKFLNMIGFLDGLYIENDLNSQYQTDDE